MKNLLSLLLLVALASCAQPKTACRQGWPQRSLESFGRFDSTTSFRDLIARVGKPDFGLNISGMLTVYYHLSDGSWLVFHTNGLSETSQIMEVYHDKKILYSRFEEVRKQTPNKSLQATRDDGSSSASRFTSFGPAYPRTGR
jgi:hypothetical protein